MTYLNYLYALVSLSFGMFSGFQGIHEVYPINSIDLACKTYTGRLYLFTRGLIPGIMFILLYSSNFSQANFLFQAIICGIGGEALLRTKIYIKQVARGEDLPEELYLGFFEKIKWYQGLFITKLAGPDTEMRYKLVEKYSSNNFIGLCNNLEKNINAVSNQQIQYRLEKIISDSKNKYINKSGNESDDHFSHKLLYAILDLVQNKHIFKTITKQ